jgi:hypothetical protein
VAVVYGKLQQQQHRGFEQYTYLLHTSDKACQVFDRNSILKCQTVALRLDTSFVDQDARISRQASKGHCDVPVQLHNLTDASSILELGDGSFLDTQYKNIVATNANLVSVVTSKNLTANSLQRVVVSSPTSKLTVSIAWY